MRYPTLYEQETSRQMVDVFKGYNHNLRIGEGEFFNMKNMTSDYYPVLSPRQARGIYASPEKATGMIAKDALCYVNGSNFVINEYSIDMSLSDEPKQLISMGAYVIIMPDKKYINTADLSDWGSMENTTITYDEVTAMLCDSNGKEYGAVTVSDQAPENHDNGDLWIDTSKFPHTLKQYSSTSSLEWIDIASTYVRIFSPGIGKGFSQYDGVAISGALEESLNGSFVLQDVGADYIIVAGILDAVVTQVEPITVSRTVPNMDFITEAGNRLWGCRYGFSAEGAIVNEIYCCKLGDFKNWSCFQGISTDSWRASVGTDGKFTGAISHLGYPCFFKENFIHKVYPSEIGAHRILDTACRGVQNGCEKSLAIVNETIYYKARSGVCAYDGSLPVEISYAMGDMRYCNAVAGAYGNKYYISMRDTAGADYHLFVYDTAKGMWHREDNLHADTFCECRGELYCIEHDTGSIVTMHSSGKENTALVEWMAETGQIGLTTSDNKYISRITVRMALAESTEVSFYVQYDFADDWESVFVTTSERMRSFSIPIRPKRCDFMKLRIEGKGDAKIYAITKTIEQGSELP